MKRGNIHSIYNRWIWLAVAVELRENSMNRRSRGKKWEVGAHGGGVKKQGRENLPIRTTRSLESTNRRRNTNECASTRPCFRKFDCFGRFPSLPRRFFTSTLDGSQSWLAPRRDPSDDIPGVGGDVSSSLGGTRSSTSK